MSEVSVLNREIHECLMCHVSFCVRLGSDNAAGTTTISLSKKIDVLEKQLFYKNRNFVFFMQKL